MPSVTMIEPSRSFIEKSWIRGGRAGVGGRGLVPIKTRSTIPEGKHGRLIYPVVS
jgi:hypothetical protein